LHRAHQLLEIGDDSSEASRQRRSAANTEAAEIDSFELLIGFADEAKTGVAAAGVDAEDKYGVNPR